MEKGYRKHKGPRSVGGIRGVELTIGGLLVAAVLAGCGRREETRKVLTIGVFENGETWRREAERFCDEQDEYTLEVVEYTRSDVPEEDGLLRLQREFASGDGPDMIDFGVDYSMGDIAGRYTEDLFPYLEREGGDYFHNILDSFSYKEGLYALPLGFQLETFVGRKDMVEDRKHWNIQEMMDSYHARKEGVILYPGETKIDVFAVILAGSVDYYVDWDRGVCRFDEEEFQKVLEFCNLFPDTLKVEEDFSVKQAFLDGDAMVLNMRLRDIYDICQAEYIFGEQEIVYIGFPVEGERGVIIGPGNCVLAISEGSRNKEAAWRFLRRFLEKDYQKESVDGFPICRSALEEEVEEAKRITYVTDSQGRQQAQVKEEVIFEGEDPIDIYHIREEQGKDLLALVEEAGINSAMDYGLHTILLEEARSYFGGDKSLEETVRVMQSRATIYINEKRN